ncbi:suaprga1 [Coniochaeta sp. PMI_546]|nr:suaprga1 [Coniochaeta sp. PMI_546]
MISLRTAARSAPRFLARTARPAARTTTLFSKQSSRVVRQTSAFSTSLFRRAAAGEVDEELSAKLGSEIEYENDVKENEPLPASIKDFLENGPFEIQDIPGKEEVTLTRNFGNEKITIKFSIADLQNYDPDMFDEDSALGEEDVDAARNNQDPNAEEDADDRADAAVPCRLTVIVEKPNQPGALNIEATAQDGSIIVDNLYYFTDKALAYGESGEAAHKAQGVYAGPPFGSLDEDLQILMERFLEERGVTQALAVFVPDYMDVKEQKEYLSWLEGLKKFIDA